MTLPIPEYLSADKRAKVEAFKERIRSGEFDNPRNGHLNAKSVTIAGLIADAVIQDEQGPWSVEDDHTELDIAGYEIALENLLALESDVSIEWFTQYPMSLDGTGEIQRDVQEDEEQANALARFINKRAVAAGYPGCAAVVKRIVRRGPFVPAHSKEETSS